jgi:hypothetical protein
MDKILVYVPTGEVRPANTDEYAVADGQPFRVASGPMVGSFAIVTRHEIEIPEGAKRIDINFPGEDNQWIGLTRVLPIPRPKVKKWQWLLRSENGSYTMSNNHDTEKKAKEIWDGGGPFGWVAISPIEETMIEVDL